MLHADNELAIQEVAREIKAARLPLETVLRSTPVHSSASNGAVEQFIRHLGGQLRTLRAATEHHHGVRLHPSLAVWPWMVRHSCWLMARFSVRASGRTAHEEAFDSRWQGELAPFGVPVLFRQQVSVTGAMTGGRRRDKGRSLWNVGIYLGRADQTNEHLLGARLGT